MVVLAQAVLKVDVLLVVELLVKEMMAAPVVLTNLVVAAVEAARVLLDKPITLEGPVVLVQQVL
jgi:hypothetical protein